MVYFSCEKQTCAEARVNNADTTESAGYVFETSTRQVVEVTIPPASVPNQVILFLTESKLPSKPNVITEIVNVTLFSTSAGEDIQPLAPIEICFEIQPDKEQCLGFLNERKIPAEWECEDRCLTTRGNLRCGKTDHLTNFAILLTGDVGNDDGCGDDQDYILGNSKQDGILIGCVVAAFWVLLIVASLYFFTPHGKRKFYGKEGSRVVVLRENAKRLSTSQSI